jgi:hypothetical protein
MQNRFGESSGRGGLLGWRAALEHPLHMPRRTGDCSDLDATELRQLARRDETKAIYDTLSDINRARQAGGTG